MVKSHTEVDHGPGFGPLQVLAGSADSRGARPEAGRVDCIMAVKKVSEPVERE